MRRNGGRIEGIGTIIPVRFEEELAQSYLDYAMSVIMSRALPDVRDGLKPVQRRILYTLGELGLRHDSPFKKSARIVGEVLGRYHPHGDAPVYEALVRLAQDFTMRYPLVEGQGNFGSIDNDPPAAMRYTEARLSRIAEEMLADIDKDTVDFMPNFDGSSREPVVLPARIPQLLLNGSSGIAVGMATNIPPHNLRELCDALIFLLENPEASIEDLLHFVHGPDFPTGGMIVGLEGIKNAYATGRGKIIVRGKARIEKFGKESSRIVITEIPYQVSKAALVERIAQLVKERRIEGISEIRDESDKEGIRIVLELRRGIAPKQILNNLYKYTPLQTAFFANMVALVDGQPRMLNLKLALRQFLDFRKEVITRRSLFELKKARERLHILEGLKIALDNLDEFISLIRSSRSPELARQALQKTFGLSAEQAQAILEMQLRRLAALERERIYKEYEETVRKISYLEDLLANPRKIQQLIRKELEEIKEKYGDDRRTQIVEEEAEEFTPEDLIPHQEVVVILSEMGYIKRIPLSAYRLQHRGGKGVVGMPLREDDAIRALVVADIHDPLLCFTSQGRVLRLDCLQIPEETSRQARGSHLSTFLNLNPGERITALLPQSSEGDLDSLIIATSKGEVKRVPKEEISSLRGRGLIIMNLKGDDEITAARMARSQDEIILITARGQSIRFPVSDLRPASRTSGGVKGVALEAGDRVVAMDIATAEGDLFTVTEKGLGKRTPLSSYPSQRRGGSGVRTQITNSQTGQVAAAVVVHPDQEVMIISKQGMIIRVRGEDIPLQRRGTRGVRLFQIKDEDRVLSATPLPRARSGII